MHSPALANPGSVTAGRMATVDQGSRVPDVDYDGELLLPRLGEGSLYVLTGAVTVCHLP